MWSVTNYFLVNLTAADLMMSIFNCIPSFIFMRDRLVSSVCFQTTPDILNSWQIVSKQKCIFSEEKFKHLKSKMFTLPFPKILWTTKKTIFLFYLFTLTRKIAWLTLTIATIIYLHSGARIENNLYSLFWPDIGYLAPSTARWTTLSPTSASPAQSSPCWPSAWTGGRLLSGSS